LARTASLEAGVFMLCPVPFGFAPDAQSGQDAPETSPMISRLQAILEVNDISNCYNVFMAL
jgi:hypothetical protein